VRYTPTLDDAFMPTPCKSLRECASDSAVTHSDGVLAAVSTP
jgi:hypothetical protein